MPFRQHQNAMERQARYITVGTILSVDNNHSAQNCYCNDDILGSYRFIQKAIQLFKRICFSLSLQNQYATVAVVNKPTQDGPTSVAAAADITGELVSRKLIFDGLLAICKGEHINYSVAF